MRTKPRSQALSSSVKQPGLSARDEMWIPVFHTANNKILGLDRLGYEVIECISVDGGKLFLSRRLMRTSTWYRPVTSTHSTIKSGG